MFKRLDWIKNCGIFADYRWDTDLPPLGRINVIYGPNGSGKTSLSGALDGLRHAENGEGCKRVSIALDDNGTERLTNGTHNPMFDCVHVFSEDYVARCHRFTPAEAEMEAVLTIGEKPVEAERKLQELRKIIDEKTVEHDEESTVEQTALRALDTIYGQVAQRVVDAASKAGGRWRSRSNFSAGVVKTAFSNSHADWVTLSEADLQEKIGIINSSKSDPIPENQLIVQPPGDIVRRLSEALASSPSTVILDTLFTHPEATSWVDTGRHFHQETGVCLFCGSAFTTERRALIDQHFSDQVERLQTDLRTIIRDLTTLNTSVESALSAIPSKGLFFEDIRSRYDDAVKALRDELTALHTWITGARVRAESKAANVLGVTNSSVEDPPPVSGTELIKLRAEHNGRVSKHDSLIQESARAIELHYLKSAEGDVKKCQETISTAHDETEKLKGELAEHRAQIASLETEDGDPLPTAKVLTEEVARLLGRNELKFEAVDGKYRVNRDDKPAIGLSVGERTAITLIHFLESVARFDTSKGRPIVVIDDPVSSLDSDIFMGVSTYIWTEAVAKEHISQIFILTHNFELFRQWDIQIEALHKSGKTIDGRKFSDVYPTEFFEIRSRHITSGTLTKRCPVLTKWPPSDRARKMIRSTYHHTFMAVSDARTALMADDSMENRLNAQLLFPNVIRRMLETFLAFKRPEWVGNLNAAMRKSADLLRAAGYQGDADALRLRLTRYAHAYSHSESPSTDIIVSPDEVSVAIASVFEFMNCLDPAHFCGLCEVTGFEPAALLPVPSLTQTTDGVKKGSDA